MSDSLTWLFTKERPWAICLRCFLPKSESLKSLFAHSLFFKEQLEQLAPVAIYKRATGAIHSFSWANRSFDHKNKRIAQKSDKRIPNPAFLQLCIINKKPVWHKCRLKHLRHAELTKQHFHRQYCNGEKMFFLNIILSARQIYICMIFYIILSAQQIYNTYDFLYNFISSVDIHMIFFSARQIFCTYDFYTIFYQLASHQKLSVLSIYSVWE